MKFHLSLLAAALFLSPLHAAVITAPVRTGAIITPASAVGNLHLAPLSAPQLTSSLPTPSLTSTLVPSIAAPAVTPAPEAQQVTTAQTLEKLSAAVSDDKTHDSGLQNFYDRQAAVRTPAAGVAAEPVAIEIYEGLNPGWVKNQSKQSKNADPKTLALQKKAQTKGFRKTALNKNLLKAHNNDYTDQLPTGRVTDQQDSGRCWIFAGLNMIRDMLVARGKVGKSFEFSENYPYFYSQLERANKHLEKVIQAIYAQGGAGEPLKAFRQLSPEVDDGGLMEDLQFLIDKYGLVPKAAMPETKSSGNTTLLNDDLDYALGKTIQQLQADARDLVTGRGGGNVMKIKAEGVERVWKILVTHLGIPPTQFSYGIKDGRKRYTPREFASRFARFDPRDYVVVAALPHMHQGVVYEMPNSSIGVAADKKNAYNWRYLNVDVDRLEELVTKSISAGQPVYFRAPVGRDIDSKTGIMHPQVYDRDAVYGMEDASQRLSRTKDFDLHLERGGHMMVFTGFDRPVAGKPVVKYKVANSWGKKIGDKGVFHMYRDWFRQYVTCITVPRSLLTSRERKAWNGKARKDPD